MKFTKGVSIVYIDNPSFEMRFKALNYQWDIFSSFDNPTIEKKQKYDELKNLYQINTQDFWHLKIRI